MRRITTLSTLAATVLASGLLAVGAAASTGVAQLADAAPTPPTTPVGSDVPPTPPTTDGPPRLPCTRSGTARADALRGTANRDVLCGLAGKDIIRLGGFDTAYGGAGNDTIYARNGTYDVIVGGPGVDRAQIDPFDQLYGVEKTF